MPDTKEVKRFIEVVEEHFNEKVEIIAEQYGSIQKDLKEMKVVQGHHTQVLSNHTEQFEIIKNDLEIIKSELRQKVDYKDFEVLEKRVLRLEARIK